MYAGTVLVCVFLSVVENYAGPARTQRMTVTKMRAADLESSASGYVYDQQQGLPVYYLQYNNHGTGGYYHAPDTVQYVAAPVAQAPILKPYAVVDDLAAGKMAHEDTVIYGDRIGHVDGAVKTEPRAPYYLEKIAEEVGNVEDETHSTEEKSEDESDGGESEDGDDHGDEGGDSDEDVHGDFDHSVKESGGGYVLPISKGDRGTHDDEHDKGYYSKKGGQEKEHRDEEEEHGFHEEAEEGEKGSNYGHSSYHKKGQKTNGFHNVYHKDEYKKETDFYDDDHKKGYFDKFEEFDKGYKATEGGFKKGGHHSSGHDQDDSGKKGYYDKGYHRSQDQGHRTEKGEKSYHSDYEDYGAEKDSKSAKAHKFHKDSGHH
ncbi:PREDICTED: protein starmaker-like [Dufourea novaeangliae]|uniref:protein starmaker-like n=1 Tax=Dufourea novaeangliae TaxID=178035 RepID=UPI00076789F2|nr:PREDICTED: protein starmaker-like [Dufourea novaeangliae]